MDEEDEENGGGSVRHKLFDRLKLAIFQRYYVKFLQIVFGLDREASSRIGP